MLHSDPKWAVERVLQQAAPCQWSPSYVVDSQRWVLPVIGLSEFRVAGQRVLLDGLTALCLPTGVPYQMRPLQATDRVSFVVSARPGAPLPPLKTPAVCILAPRSLWQMRLHWRGTHGDAASPFMQAVPEQRGGAGGIAAGPGTRGSERVWRARQFMAQRVSAADGKPWSVQHVADAVNCSAFHLAHVFRQNTGMSLHGYRQRLLLALALQRLEDGETDLAGLAHDLGYCSQSHLGAVFRREVGVTLAQARSALKR
ncbi:MAG: helix-turn-helix domain-containing protein [Betaproteobacteria bacterium]